MVKRVNFPDGTHHDFPDEMSEQAVKNIARDFWKTKNTGLNPSFGEKTLVGLGSGLNQFGLGLAQAMSKLSEIGAPREDLEDARSQTQELGRLALEQQRQFASTPVGSSATGQISQAVGGIIPTLAIPGGVVGTLPAKVGTGMLSGGAIGAIQPVVPGGPSRLEQTVAGGLLGGAAPVVLSGLGKAARAAFTRPSSRAASSLASSPNAVRAAEIAQREGVPIFAADIGSPITQKSAVLAESVPFVGTELI
jgi:hypothetical protein